jgi:Family of unknown function (DUF6153)
VISQVVSRRVGQLLLLIVLALGVMGMHTLGHPSGEHRADAIPAAAPVMTSLHHAATVTEGVAAGGFSATPPHMPPTDPMKVCVAILTAMGLAAMLLALLTMSRRGSGTRAVDGGAQTSCGRGPPTPVPPLPRRLAALSVLRM